MKKFVIVVAIMAALLVVARADGLSFSVTPTPFGGIDYGFSGGPSGHHGSGGGSGGNDLLLSTGAGNYLLLSDGVSKLCLSSGC
ncbi:MAG TPA: hypothetical protein VMS08_02835 [Candidatus Saccharimonadia bacterium]|jgi:hypothetical protein|nr:hypothetical protein [Candidatus Saccharimonadia bacterium]